MELYKEISIDKIRRILKEKLNKSHKKVVNYNI